MKESSSIHPLLWPAVLAILVGVIAAGWRWGNLGSEGAMPSLPASIATPPLPEKTTAPPLASAAPANTTDEDVERAAALNATQPAPAIASKPQPAPMNPSPPPFVIQEEVRQPTPEELAAIPPPPEAVAAMKAGPPPDVLRGMQNPPQHMMQGTKMIPPEFKHALNPPGTPPPVSTKP